MRVRLLRVGVETTDGRRLASVELARGAEPVRLRERLGLDALAGLVTEFRVEDGGWLTGKVELRGDLSDAELHGRYAHADLLLTSGAGVLDAMTGVFRGIVIDSSPGSWEGMEIEPPACHECGVILTPGGYAQVCSRGDGPSGRVALPAYCANRECAARRDEAAMAKAVASGVIDP